jgi:hypothetical protein
LEKARRDAKDLAIIDANAERLNEEAEDVRGYQEGAGRIYPTPTRARRREACPTTRTKGAQA